VGNNVYFVELSQRSQKYLDKLDKHVRKRIEKRLKNLGSKPVPKDSKFMG
jgi:mRNA-degrading endonuclease RelE of RelBE toxin-antitoxin system